MKIVFFSFVMLICTFSQGQDLRKRIDEMISTHLYPLAPKVQELKEPVNLKEQIENFINEINKDNNNDKRILFTIRVHELDTIRNDYSFSLSYFLTSFEYNIINPTHYFMIGENAVVLWASPQNSTSIFTVCGIKTIEKKDKDILIGYLHHLDGTYFVRYWAKKLTYCKSGENIKKTYFLGEECMPGITQIRPKFPDGVNLPTEWQEFPDYLHPDYLPPHLLDKKENEKEEKE